jgi:hypothetical protein
MGKKAFNPNPASIQNLLEHKREEILRIARRYGVINVRVFGSAARGEFSPESDIDFIIQLERDWSLLEHVAFMQELEDLLDRKVDVVVEEGLRGILRTTILKEAVPL